MALGLLATSVCNIIALPSTPYSGALTMTLNVEFGMEDLHKIPQGSQC